MAFKKKIDTESLLFFVGFVVAAFVFGYIPYIHWPFEWMQTYFHEISHGLVTLIIGGKIVSIELNWDGSGLCTSQGGIRFLTAFAGYAGAVLWGALIYLMGTKLSPKVIDHIASAFIIIMSVTALFWARDVVTLIILAIIVLPFVVILKIKDHPAEKWLLQFTGVFVLLDAVRSPLNLLYLGDDVRMGDAETLQELTWLPAYIWIFIWFGIGIAALVFLFRQHVKI